MIIPHPNEAAREIGELSLCAWATSCAHRAADADIQEAIRCVFRKAFYNEFQR